MRLKGIVVEDFSNYKLPSLFLISSFCDWKCCKESNSDISLCQNSMVALNPIVDISDEDIYKKYYKENNITKAVVVGGLEPFLQYDELYYLINVFRFNNEMCDFVIYTGYYPNEIEKQISQLSKFENIIIKFGRYIPNMKPVFDDILGVSLVSCNQFAKRIS